MSTRPNPTPIPTQTPTPSELPFDEVITSEDELRKLYRQPVAVVANKKLDHMEPWIRVTIAAARFAFVATADRAGRPTVSPRGGNEGFVTVLDERRLAIADYAGNNLIDSLRNIVENPSIGIIFVVPGRNETIRVDGDAWVSVDPEVLRLCRKGDRRRVKTAICVRVRSVFFHCPSSFNRATLWESNTWRDDVDLEYDDFIRRSLPPDEWPSWA